MEKTNLSLIFPVGADRSHKCAPPCVFFSHTGFVNIILLCCNPIFSLTKDNAKASPFLHLGESLDLITANNGLKLSAHLWGQWNPFEVKEEKGDRIYLHRVTTLVLAVSNRMRRDLPFVLFYIFNYTNNETLERSSEAFIDYLAASLRGFFFSLLKCLSFVWL